MATTMAEPATEATFVPVVWQCDRYPNLRQRLPGLDGFAQFQGGSYVAQTAEEHAALQAIRRERIAPVKPYNGVPVYKCGLCGFASHDEEEVEYHRAERHSMNDLED